MKPPPSERPRQPFPWAVLGLLVVPLVLTLLFLPGLGSGRVEEPPAPSARPSSPPRGVSRSRPGTTASMEDPRAPGSADPVSSSPEERQEPPVLEGLAEHTLAGKTLWEKRLIRAQRTLENYLEATKYPFSSQPMSRHRDMEKPNFVGAIKLPLVTADQKKTTDAKVTLNQDRAILQGDEAVVLRVSCENSEGPSRASSSSRRWRSRRRTCATRRRSPRPRCLSRRRMAIRPA